MKTRNVPLPPNRTIEQLYNHYQIEKEIASRLKKATREERREIYATMYDELFARVPDHSRLQIRDDAALTAAANATKWPLLEPYLNESTVFVEFAPGACRFAVEVCPRVKKVIGIDISDQTGGLPTVPDNFELIVYNGYELDMAEGSVDVVFSDQLLEHIHPEDTRHHLTLINHMLKPGGIYVLRTPHGQSGPHDVSRFFSDVPEGFHLKEWTYKEFQELVRSLGFSSWAAYRPTKGRMVHLPMPVVLAAEAMFSAMPTRARVRLSGRMFNNNIVLVVRK